MIKKNKKVCIVGIGKHAYVNLIPSLKKKNFKIVGLVSRSPKFFNRNFKVYKNLEIALKKLPKDTLYILSTPPRTHYKIIKTLAYKDKNVLVEKPVVINKKQVDQINKFNFSQKNVVYEMYMYRFTQCYQKSINYCKNNIENIKLIEFSFLLPSYPENTFRNSLFLEDSCLYDIGCYIFDFSMELGHKIKNIELLSLRFKKKLLMKVKFQFKIRDIKIKAEIGLASKYQNKIKITKNNQTYVILDKIFFGKKVRKEINYSDNLNTLFYIDDNGYDEMFKKLNLKNIVKGKLVNYNKTKEIYRNLDYLRKKIENC